MIQNFGGRKLWWNSSHQRLADNILANAQNYQEPKIIIMPWLLLIKGNHRVVLPWHMVKMKVFTTKPQSRVSRVIH